MQVLATNRNVGLVYLRDMPLIRDNPNFVVAHWNTASKGLRTRCEQCCSK